MFSFSWIQKTFENGFRLEFVANERVELERGSVLLLVGGNGSGKSTLLNVLGLADDVRVSSDVVLSLGNGEGVLTYSAEWIRGWRTGLRGKGLFRIVHRLADRPSRIRRDHFGFLLQEGHLLDGLSVRENAFLRIALGGGVTSRDSLNGALNRLFLETSTARDEEDAGRWARSSPAGLSGGMKQRVAMERCFAHPLPSVVFADEPLNHLDIEVKRTVIDKFARFAVGAIVKSGVQATESSGGLIDCCYLDSIFEFDSSDYFGQVIESA